MRTTDIPTTPVIDVFADPVAYLGLHGIEAQLVDETPTPLPVAA
jgi:hypothetical protein